MRMRMCVWVLCVPEEWQALSAVVAHGNARRLPHPPHIRQRSTNCNIISFESKSTYCWFYIQDSHVPALRS